MAFEQPDPSLYPPPASLQPKRPVAAEAATGTNEVTMVGRVGATPTTARTAPQDTQTSGGKAMPASVPTSAMRTGPTPLSQTQKRPMTTFTSSQQPQQHGSQVKKPESDPAVSKPGGELSPAAPQGQSAPAEDNNGFPTLQVRMAGHPATFPPIGPVYPYDQQIGWR
ncbi:hypothetical protein GGR51DRAFT_540461 [Nemania sp. FL0031]|nr:hypothetical protein GGR51DRAFT_540461 [Nemania sp. FL0031]